MIGTFEAVTDQAGRVTIPLALRRALGDDLVICPAMPPERHLLVFERAAFEAFQRRLFPFEPVTADTVSLKRSTVGRAHEAKVDKAGRVLVPQRLRDWADANAEVIVLGMGDHLEIWSASRYDTWAEMVDSDDAARRFAAMREELERASRNAAAAANHGPVH